MFVRKCNLEKSLNILDMKKCSIGKTIINRMIERNNEAVTTFIKPCKKLI